MNKNEETISRCYLGENTLIGYRDDHTLFWLRTDQNYWKPDKGEFNVLEAGEAWINEKTNTTILDFPILDEVEINNLKQEFVQGDDGLSHYGETDYYVQLTNCLRNSPIKPENQSSKQIDHDYDLPENMEGYVLNENTFLRKNIDTCELTYLKFTEFSMNDIENDSFGWIKAAREFLSFPSSDEELLTKLNGFVKQSYGDAWIDENEDVVILGPVCNQEIDFLDHYFYESIDSYLGLYSEWNQTKSWIDIESGVHKNPVNFRLNYFYLIEKFMGN